MFQNSKLGKGYYQDVYPWDYRDKHSVEGTSYDFIPVSLFWKNPKLKMYLTASTILEKAGLEILLQDI